MIVDKFGGTSLANAERIASVAGIIASSRGGAQAVVVSALAGATDHLIAAARAAAGGQTAEYEAGRRWLCDTHHRVVDELLATSPERTRIRASIDRQLDRLQRLLDSIAVLGELTARGHDAVASVGEKLSATVVAAVLRHRRMEAQSICGTELIITDDVFGSASPRMEVTRNRIAERVRPLLDQGVVPVICGYTGATEAGAPTTLGRSGSDFSAAIIAACLESDALRIWTDVDGILTADPNVVPDARVLRELSYAEAARLACFGAEVLHPRTIGPVIQHGIPLTIRNSFNPDDPGTRIVQSPTSDRRLWPAIVSATGLQLLRLRSGNGSWQLRSATDALARLGGAGIEVRMFSQSLSEQGLSLVVGEQDGAHSAQLLSRSLSAAHPKSLHERVLDMIEDVATVSVIGLPSDRPDRIASRAFAALGKHRVRVVAVAQAATEDSVTFCIPAREAGETVRFLHEELGLGNGNGGGGDCAGKG